MTIATISRQFGSNGDGIARAVAQLLEIETFDKESLQRTLQALGIEDEAVLRYDEHRPHLWDGFSVDRDRYAHFLRLAILDQARRGPAVFVGRGAHLVLGDVPSALTVRVVAPFETRVRRVRDEYVCSEEHARRMVRATDHDRAGFYRFFFDVDWEDPAFYDLVLNTYRTDGATAAATIAEALSLRRSEARDAESTIVLEDRYLSALVAARIRFSADLSLRFLDVRAHGGVVTLTGTVGSNELLERCVSVASAVPGVRDVVRDVQVVPQYLGVV